MTVSRPFHVQLYCASSAQSEDSGSNFDYQGAMLTRAIPPQGMGFFGCSFEQWMHKMLQRPGVYAEGDGSWSWTAQEKNERGAPVWRMEGMIYDRDGKVFYVDVQGQCTADAWRDMVEALQARDERLSICLAELGVWVSASGFEQWLAI